MVGENKQTGAILYEDDEILILDPENGL